MTLGTILPLLFAVLPVTDGELLFGPATMSSLGPFPGQTFKAGDVDGDGLADIAFFSTGGVVAIQLGNGTGGFGPIITSAAPGVTGNPMALADLDGDGLVDLLVTHQGLDILSVSLANGAGGFSAPVTLALGPSPEGRTIRTGDADGDGDADVVVATEGVSSGPFGEARLLLNDGAGALAPGLLLTGDAAHVVLDGFPASLDGDRHPDLVLSAQSGPTLSTSAWLGDAFGGASQAWAGADLEVRQVADLDGDGDADLVSMPLVLPEPWVLTAVLGAGDGTFAIGPATDLLPFGAAIPTIEVADLDADGIPDLVLTVGLASPGAESWMARGDGTGGFELPGARVTQFSSQIGAVSARLCGLADFDGDGRLDVATSVTASFGAEAAVSLNRTYVGGGPLRDLGHQLKGTFLGYPIQVAQGSFVGGTPFSFQLTHGPKSGIVYHVLGFSVINAPFKGGTMVPKPDFLSGPWVTNSAGKLNLAGNWPMGAPPGLEITAQFWFAAPAVAGFAASSAVVVTMP